jgi:signal transduction histidine kinase
MKRREAIATLIAGTMIVLALMAVFAIELSSTQANSRQALEKQAHQRAVLVSNLVDALFGAASRPTATTIAAYSTPHVSRAVLNRNRGQNLYVALFDASGHMLAASSGVTAQARAELTPQNSAALGLMVTGRPWALGNILPYGSGSVINFGVRLPTAAGPRILISGIQATNLSQFLLAELSRIPGAKAEYHSVLDGHRTIIASTNPSRPLGYHFHTPAQLHVLNHGAGVINKYYFDQISLPNTTWKLLISAPAATFFASVSGFRHWLPWVIFAAFGLVCLVALLLARRSMRSSVEILEARDRLAGAHAQVSEINARLETSNAALAASNGELERRAQELVRSNSELDQFASIASHDLQEPLRKVRTFTERIGETEGERLSEQGLTYLRRANASAERMQQLIEDLLRYSRVATQGRAFGPVDLGQVTADVVEDLDETIAQSGAVINVGPMPVISADATQMRQLMQNLVSNAIKFRREGVSPQVDIAATPEEGWVQIVVRDNGIGFDPQYARRIFRVFERLHGRGAYPGTGIGLALCRKIAERHGGSVSADSVLGEGSTFTVTLQTQRTEAVSETSHAIDPSDHADADSPGSDGWDPAGSSRAEDPHVAV